ncbi:hypothetical protein EMCRGX_G016862 [Ephydatia muelleri]
MCSLSIVVHPRLLLMVWTVALLSQRVNPAIISAFESDIIEPPAVVSAEREESASAVVDSSLSHLSEADSYKPFASKQLAMAYLVVHSPRPMGQSNLKFILHTLRTPRSAVPSLSRLAKYRLPGYVTPKMEGQDGIYANVHKLEHHPGTPVNGYVLSETVCIAVCCIKAVLPELQTWALNIFQYQDGCLVRLTDDEYITLSSSHPMKAKSIECGGLPVIMAPISNFSDDTSGNKSKAPVMEMAVLLVQEFNALEREGIVVFNAFLQCKVIVVAPISLRQSSWSRNMQSAGSNSGDVLQDLHNISKYYKSFVGRDFKTLAQLALFVFPPLVSPGETEVQLALSKVFKLVYCERFTPDKVESMKSVCLGFAQAVGKHCPELRSKLKIHLLLHLPDHMLQFGPPSGFNTER